MHSVGRPNRIWIRILGHRGGSHLLLLALLLLHTKDHNLNKIAFVSYDTAKGERRLETLAACSSEIDAAPIIE